MEITSGCRPTGEALRMLLAQAASGVRWAGRNAVLNELAVGSVSTLMRRELLLRALHEVMQPLGVSEATLKAWLFSRAGYVAPPGLIRSSTDLDQTHLPLFASNTGAGLPAIR